jgi:uncharacterized protein involved in copper resistance
VACQARGLTGQHRSTHPGPRTRRDSPVALRRKFQHRNDSRHHSRSSCQGQLIARLEGSYNQRITQRLIFQPRLELNLSAQDMPAQRLGSRLSNAELGLRLRYEVKREFAPYIGVSWTWKAGQTADYARLDGTNTAECSLVFGIRTWF